jgi:hypothetical protein
VLRKSRNCHDASGHFFIALDKCFLILPTVCSWLCIQSVDATATTGWGAYTNSCIRYFDGSYITASRVLLAPVELLPGPMSIFNRANH